MFRLIGQLQSSEHESFLPNLRIDWIHLGDIEPLLVLPNDGLTAILLHDAQLSLWVAIGYWGLPLLTGHNSHVPLGLNTHNQYYNLDDLPFQL